MDEDWKGADLFGTDADDVVTHECPEDALAEDVEGIHGALLDGPELACALREDETAVEIVGYKRASLASADLYRLTESAADSLADNLCDELWINPESLSTFQRLSGTLARAIHADVVRCLKEIGAPWRLERVASRKYDCEEIIEALDLEPERRPNKRG